MTMAPLGTSILGQARAGLTTPSGMRTARCTTTPFRLLDFFPRQTDMFVFSFFWGGGKWPSTFFFGGKGSPNCSIHLSPGFLLFFGANGSCFRKRLFGGFPQRFYTCEFVSQFLTVFRGKWLLLQKSSVEGCPNCSPHFFVPVSCNPRANSEKVLWRVPPTVLYIFPPVEEFENNWTHGTSFASPLH